MTTFSPPYSLNFKAYKQSLKYFNTNALKQKFNQLIRLESIHKPPRSQLIFLAKHGHLDLIRIIAQHPYPADLIQELFSITSSHSEYYHGKLSLLLLKGPIPLDINIPSHPLLSASTAGNPDLVELLVTYDIPSEIINSSLHLAARHNRPSCLKSLLGHPSSLPTIDDLLTGCTHGYLKIVKLLILDGRITPSPECLIKAAEGGYLLIIIILSSHNIFDGIERVMYIAHVNGFVEVARYLFKRARDDGRYGFGCIKFVVKVGYLGGLVELLGEVEDADAQEGVLVRLAVKYDQVECLRVLLEDGRADPSHCGNLALRMARDKGFSEAVMLLMNDERVVEREKIDCAVPEKWTIKT